MKSPERRPVGIAPALHEDAEQPAVQADVQLGALVLSVDPPGDDDPVVIGARCPGGGGDCSPGTAKSRFDSDYDNFMQAAQEQLDASD